MCLIGLKQIDLETALKYELAPVPTAMFEDDGNMRYPKSKSVLKTTLEVETSTCSIPAPDTLVIDGSAIFWTLAWPKEGTVTDLMELMYDYIESKLISQDVYFVFDRYFLYSIKGSTRENRVENRTNHQYFSLSAPLPPRDKPLSSSLNKKQLIDLIVAFVSERIALRKHRNSLILTGSDETPIEIHDGNIIKRNDLRTTHEEADVIIVHQCYKAVEEGSAIVKIISDDTDVFALACHFFPKEKSDTSVFMEPTKSSRTVADIGVRKARTNHKFGTCGTCVVWMRHGLPLSGNWQKECDQDIIPTSTGSFTQSLFKHG